MLILFDIDGTLLLTRGAGIDAMYAAASEVFGFAVARDSTRFAGNLDPLIWESLCAENGIRETAEHFPRFRGIYARELARRLAEGGRAHALPGVADLLAALAARPASLGLLTGNFPETGSMKLAAAGLDREMFKVCAWGTDARTRPGLVPVAMERCAQELRRAYAAREILVVGDTPYDVETATAHGCRSLAVATGRYSVDELEKAGADLALGDLTATTEIVRWIFMECGGLTPPCVLVSERNQQGASPCQGSV